MSGFFQRNHSIGRPKLGFSDDSQKRPLVVFRRKDDMIDNDWRERRLVEFLALEVRGLAVRRELPDGSTELYFP
jgi:hypothetical protein